MANSYDIPPEMRDLAEKSVDQARKAFDSFMAAAHKAVSTFGSSSEIAQTGARDLSRQAIGYAEANVSATFEFARRLLAAKDVAEVLQLQANFARSQMETLGKQMQEMSTSVTQAASRSAAEVGNAAPGASTPSGENISKT